MFLTHALAESDVGGDLNIEWHLGVYPRNILSNANKDDSKLLSAPVQKLVVKR